MPLQLNRSSLESNPRQTRNGADLAKSCGFKRQSSLSDRFRPDAPIAADTELRTSNQPFGSSGDLVTVLITSSRRAQS